MPTSSGKSVRTLTFTAPMVAPLSAGRWTAWPARVCLLVCLAPACVCLNITFTGHVVTDFSAGTPGVFVAPAEPGPSSIAYNGGGTGWTLTDTRFAYDYDSDTAFFGAWRELGVCEGCAPAYFSPIVGSLFVQA